jgi:hypothetical protein
MNPLAIVTVFGFGFFYLVGAVPAGMAVGLSAAASAFIAWCGYAAGAWVMIFAANSLGKWIARKLKIPDQPDPEKFLSKVWSRFGLIGLGLLAPVTIGPQAGCVMAIAFGEKPWKAATALSLGVVPWCVGFAYAGAQVAKGVG